MCALSYIVYKTTNLLLQGVYHGRNILTDQIHCSIYMYMLEAQVVLLLYLYMYIVCSVIYKLPYHSFPLNIVQA